MIRIRFGKDDDRLALRICGHAGYAAPGQDIVCAAVSMLAQSFSLAAGSAPGAAACTRAASGQLTVTCADTPETRAMLRMCRVGFRALEAAYGQWVQVEDVQQEPGI